MTQDWVILKFGGSSVGKAEHWQTIKQQVEKQLTKGLHPVLVLSALKNVSNLLETLLHQSLAGNHIRAIKHLEEHHAKFSAKLGINSNHLLSSLFTQLTSDCDNIWKNQLISPQQHARVLAIGELLSTTIGAEFLKSKNLNVVWQDARELLKSSDQTDPWHHYTSAQCEYRYDEKVEQCLQGRRVQDSSLQPHVIVTQGFIASDEKNDTVLLGREGSDTSATYLGALIGAKEIQIWTDVPGVFSCNPRENAQARHLPQLSYEDAHRMALYGAKVLHPRALKPAQDYMIPIWVKSTNLPEQPGTQINQDTIDYPEIKAIVYESPVIYVNTETQQPESAPTKKLQSQLFSLGYDTLLHEPLDTISLVAKYTNTDLPEQQTDHLITLLEKQYEDNCSTKLKISTKLALITIVGTCNKPDWQQELKTVCEQCKELVLLQEFSNSQLGRFSLLVPEQQAQQWCLLLHRFIVENASGSQRFGANWLNFESD